MKLFSNVTPQFGRDLRNLKHNDLTVGVPREKDWIEVGDDEDAEVRYVAKKIMEKLGKYWLEQNELNPNMKKILNIVAMLDPRQKMKHVKFCLKKVYGDARANEFADLRNSCNILCVASEEDDEDGSSELTPLLLSRHSAWGRVLSIFRNSLAPEMVKALICSKDWLRSSSSSADLMEEEGEPIPFLRKQYFETVEALHKDGKVTWPLDDAELGELERTYSSDHDES
ncbi:hypothetical protein SASPL_115353 [Salvia splendens]|uniref:hAT-like transposase RNase-H fold domain-containing protein n=1 Tax=Salvia splendens TaxID=180675 RepID=A0A8X8Y3L5_SALSN|nr:hypothetical protein SASPL_115353 [Salvia splendens]